MYRREFAYREAVRKEFHQREQPCWTLPVSSRLPIHMLFAARGCHAPKHLQLPRHALYRRQRVSQSGLPTLDQVMPMGTLDAMVTWLQHAYGCRSPAHDTRIDLAEGNPTRCFGMLPSRLHLPHQGRTCGVKLMLLIVREDGGRGDPSEMVNATGNVWHRVGALYRRIGFPSRTRLFCNVLALNPSWLVLYD